MENAYQNAQVAWDKTKKAYTKLNQNMVMHSIRFVAAKSLTFLYNKASGTAKSENAQNSANRVIARHVDYFVNKGINPLNIIAFALSNDTPVGMVAYGGLVAAEMTAAIRSAKRAKEGALDTEPKKQWLSTRACIGIGLAAVAVTQGVNIAEAWDNLQGDLTNVWFKGGDQNIIDNALEMILHGANAIGAGYVLLATNQWRTADIYKLKPQSPRASALMPQTA